MPNQNEASAITIPITDRKSRTLNAISKKKKCADVKPSNKNSRTLLVCPLLLLWDQYSWCHPKICCQLTTYFFATFKLATHLILTVQILITDTQSLRKTSIYVRVFFKKIRNFVVAEIWYHEYCQFFNFFFSFCAPKKICCQKTTYFCTRFCVENVPG